MAPENRPTIIRLAIYWIVAGGMLGLLIGLAFATGVVDWVYGELTTPAFLPPIMVLVWLWIAKTMLMALALWTVDRFGHGWQRIASLFLIFCLYAASAGWIAGFVVLRDVSVAFYAILASWVLTVLTLIIIRQAQNAASIMMWPVFFWTTFMLAVSFELMRLNTGLQLAGLL